jgi:hypothetical protein
MLKKLGISILLVSFLSMGNVFAQEEEVDNEPAEEINDADKKEAKKEKKSEKKSKKEKKSEKKKAKKQKKKSKKEE